MHRGGHFVESVSGAHSLGVRPLVRDKETDEVRDRVRQSELRELRLCLCALRGVWGSASVAG